MSVLTRLFPLSIRHLRLQCRNCTSRKNESPLKGLLNDSAAFNETSNDWATQPYPYLPSLEQDEENKSVSRETSIILFPGQGTHYLGMGKDLIKYPAVKDLYDCASEIAGCDLSNITDENQLDKYSQLMIVVTSLAGVEQLRDERPSALPACVGAAGFSLGEITALIFTGSLTIEEGLKLVHIRMLAMQAASKVRPGGMYTVIYGPETKLRNVLQDAIEYATVKGENNPFCAISNFLYPQCVVISGSPKSLEYVSEKGGKYGIRRAKRINVIGAFHSEAMNSAVKPMTEALKLCSIETPLIPVYSGMDSKPYRTSRDVISRLPKQLCTPLKWEQLMHRLYSRPKGVGFPRTFEIGPGNTLRSILRKVNAPAWDNSYSIST